MKINYNQIVQTVSSLIKKYHTRDPFELCDFLNIFIRYKDLGDVKAFFFYQSRIKNIVINQNEEDSLQKILCAHELGHALLHEDRAKMRGFQEIEVFDSLVPTEYEANLFAAELLIEDQDLINLIKEEKSIYEIAQILSVPLKLLLFKIKQMNEKGHEVPLPLLIDPHFMKSISPTF